MIELHQVTKKYDEYTVVDKFSYEFKEGTSYALVGVSGAGKTTLLNIIGKLEKIDGGDVVIDGIPLSEIKEKNYFKSYISYIFQNFGLIENKTIKENLDLSFVGKKISKEEKLQKMLEALKMVNLNLSLDRKIFSLSGGESQRVAIAKTILKDSPIILADEPTASLDEKNSEEIIDLILRLKKENKIIIIATHTPSVFNRMDKIIEIKKEKI
ncbi:MAG: putative bacteriocin export ABC transporter [Streptococcus sp.]|nr:putative bacteriocin export ABC transporter [Streptococcus sp.]